MCQKKKAQVVCVCCFRKTNSCPPHTFSLFSNSPLFYVTAFDTLIKNILNVSSGQSFLFRFQIMFQFDFVFQGSTSETNFSDKNKINHLVTFSCETRARFSSMTCNVPIFVCGGCLFKIFGTTHKLSFAFRDN